MLRSSGSGVFDTAASLHGSLMVDHFAVTHHDARPAVNTPPPVISGSYRTGTVNVNG